MSGLTPLYLQPPAPGPSFTGGGERSWGVLELHSTPELMFRKG